MKWKRSKKAQHDSKKEPSHNEEKKTKEQPVEEKPPQLAGDQTAVKPPPLLDRERIIALERERAMAAANFNSNLENNRRGMVLSQDGGRPMDMFRPYVV